MFVLSADWICCGLDHEDGNRAASLGEASFFFGRQFYDIDRNWGAREIYRNMPTIWAKESEGSGLLKITLSGPRQYYRDHYRAFKRDIPYHQIPRGCSIGLVCLTNIAMLGTSAAVFLMAEKKSTDHRKATAAIYSKHASRQYAIDPTSHTATTANFAHCEQQKSVSAGSIDWPIAIYLLAHCLGHGTMAEECTFLRPRD